MEYSGSSAQPGGSHLPQVMGQADATSWLLHTPLCLNQSQEPVYRHQPRRIRFSSRDSEHCGLGAGGLVTCTGGGVGTGVGSNEVLGAGVGIAVGARVFVVEGAGTAHVGAGVGAAVAGLLVVVGNEDSSVEVVSASVLGAGVSFCVVGVDVRGGDIVVGE